MVSIHPSDDDISAFWEWFAAIADELGDDFENETLQHELDVRLADLGVAWELGPGSTATYALAISPDGDPELLPLTQRIVSMAPELARWEFLPARPARAASLEFSIATDSGEKVVIDARSWRYVLFEFPDRKFDIVLEQGDLTDAVEDLRYTAAVVLLDAVLGEGRRLRWIRDIEPVAALSPELEKKASPIAVLSEHLDSLC